MFNAKPAIVGRRTVLALATVSLCLAPMPAQTAKRPPINRSFTSIVKPDRIADYEAAVKQYNEEYGKLPGGRARLTYQSVTGPNEFRLVREYDKFSEMDPNPAAQSIQTNANLARIAARINACVERNSQVVSVYEEALSLPRPSQPPTMLVSARSLVAPDKVDEWMGIIKNEMVPAMKKANAAYTVRRTRFGGPTNEFYVTTRINAWADIDNPLPSRKAMGDEAYLAMTKKLAAITRSREVNVIRYRPDLSYNPAASH